MNAYNVSKIKVSKEEFNMKENSFIQKVKNSFFEESTIELEELKKMLKEVMPVEGYVDSEMFEEDGVMTSSLRTTTMKISGMQQTYFVS